MNPPVIAALLGTLLLPGPAPVPLSGLLAPVPAASDRMSAPAAPLEPAPRAAVWPLDPEPQVVTGFSPPTALWSAGHRGADLLGAPGAPVRAALEGRISFAGTIAGRGVVVVDHGTFRTTYEPVRAGVRRGDRVEAAQVIGTLQPGRSHCAPRTCLHWGLIEAGSYLDPLTLVRPARVRLLPVGPQARG